MTLIKSKSMRKNLIRAGSDSVKTEPGTAKGRSGVADFETTNERRI